MKGKTVPIQKKLDHGLDMVKKMLAIQVLLTGEESLLLCLLTCDHEHWSADDSHWILLEGHELLKPT